jgi:hypothetical protein
MRPHKWGLLTALVGIIRGGFQPDARMLPPNFRSFPCASAQRRSVSATKGSPQTYDN